MDFISEEFLAARTGEALEERLHDSDTFRQQMKSLHEASKAFSKDSGMSRKTGNCMTGWKMNGQSIIFCLGRRPTVWVLKMGCR